MNSSWLKTVLSVSVLSLGACLLPATTWAVALPLPGSPLEGSLTVSIDENGVVIVNGKLITMSPGNLSACALPQSVVAGDVVLMDPNAQEQTVISDILRFRDLGHGFANTVQLLSDNLDGGENASDVGFGDLQPNHIVIPEAASEITLYTVGTVESQQTHNSSYTIYSDAGIVPEPGSLALLMTGGLPLLGFLRRRRSA